MEAFVESQFAYCPLIWMFSQRSSNAPNNHLHERALRIVYSDSYTNVENLLRKDHSLSIHHKYIQLLAIELWKVENNLSTQLICKISNLRNTDYNLRFQTGFNENPINTVNYCLKSATRKVAKYRVFSGPYFSAFGPKTGKYAPEKTPYLDTFPKI